MMSKELMTPGGTVVSKMCSLFNLSHGCNEICKQINEGKKNEMTHGVQ